MKIYEVLIGGVPHTLQLHEEDAKRYGDDATEVKSAPAPANKARAAKNKES